MDNMVIVYLFVFYTSINTAADIHPGKFFWRPRIEYARAAPKRYVYQPISQNIRNEYVLLIDGYSLGLTVVAISAGYYAAGKPFLHLNPNHAPFYTNAYRWGLRHLSLIQPWIGGFGSRYIDTQKLWRRRFHYMDEFVPTWMRRLAPWIDKEEWELEENFMKKFKFFAEPAFGKHYRYPVKTFRNYRSQITEETMENMEAVYDEEP